MVLVDLHVHVLAALKHDVRAAGLPRDFAATTTGFVALPRAEQSGLRWSTTGDDEYKSKWIRGSETDRRTHD